MPAIVLLTDFGSRDYFVGVMKGVISDINPVARVVDLTHEIEPQNVRQAAFVLWASRNYFPEDTIFVCVVDPGVGTDRRIICGMIDGRTYVAPDNGLLDYVAAEASEVRFHAATNRRYFRRNISTTFHGRDIFAPLGAHLSRGVRLSELGEVFSYPKVEKFYKPVSRGKNDGHVVYHDRFGNVFTNLLWDDVLLNGKASARVGAKSVTKFFNSYSESRSRSVVGIKGSVGLLELAVNLGNASRALKSSLGQKVTLTLK